MLSYEYNCALVINKNQEWLNLHCLPLQFFSNEITNHSNVWRICLYIFLFTNLGCQLKKIIAYLFCFIVL